MDEFLNEHIHTVNLPGDGKRDFSHAHENAKLKHGEGSMESPDRISFPNNDVPPLTLVPQAPTIVSSWITTKFSQRWVAAKLPEKKAREVQSLPIRHKEKSLIRRGCTCGLGLLVLGFICSFCAGISTERFIENYSSRGEPTPTVVPKTEVGSSQNRFFLVTSTELATDPIK